MNGKQPKIQLKLAFDLEDRGEASTIRNEGIEPFRAERRTESPDATERLMEEVCECGNCLQALTRVKSNKGNPGIDDMTVEELPEYLKEKWPTIREQLLNCHHAEQCSWDYHVDGRECAEHVNVKTQCSRGRFQTCPYPSRITRLKSPWIESTKRKCGLIRSDIPESQSG